MDSQWFLLTIWRLNSAPKNPKGAENIQKQCASLAVPRIWLWKPLPQKFIATLPNVAPSVRWPVLVFAFGIRRWDTQMWQGACWAVLLCVCVCLSWSSLAGVCFNIMFSLVRSWRLWSLSVQVPRRTNSKPPWYLNVYIFNQCLN